MAGQAPQQETSRGSGERIRNAQVRFSEKRGAQLTSARVKQEAEIKKATSDDQYWNSANDARYTESAENGQATTRHARINKRAIADIRAMFQKEGEALSDEDLNELTTLNAKPATLPDFPFFIVSLAVLKDIIDFGDLLIVGIVITTALSFVIAVILFFWVLGKTSGGRWKKKILKKLFVRLGIVITIEFIPFFKILPVTTVFVLLAHYDETKVVKLINSGLERLRGSNFMRS